MRSFSLRLLAGAGLLLLAGCGRRPAGGLLSVRWMGRDTGKFAAPAQAGWCDSAQRLVVTAIDDDNGVGLLAYPVDSVEADNYPAFEVDPDSVPPRPGAVAALRIYGQTTLRGYQSDSGSLTLRSGGERWNARFAFRMLSPDGSDTLELIGTATGLRLDSNPPICLTRGARGGAPQ